MLKKHKIILIITSILAITAVIYLYSKNYIVFESGIHIIIPKGPDNSYVKKEFRPANVEMPPETDTQLAANVKILPPKDETTKVMEEPRMFDDIMKAVETFMPLATIVVPIYLHTKNKKKRKADEE